MYNRQTFRSVGQGGGGRGRVHRQCRGALQGVLCAMAKLQVIYNCSYNHNCSYNQQCRALRDIATAASIATTAGIAHLPTCIEQSAQSKEGWKVRGGSLMTR